MRLGGSLRRRRDRGGLKKAATLELGSRQRVFGILAGLALVGWLGGYLVSTQIMFPAPPPPGDLFEVPDVRGLGLASARERLAGANLALGVVDSLRHPTVNATLILGQSPLPGQLAVPETT